MIRGRPGRLAPLLASIAVGAVLAGTGLTMAGTPDWIPLGGSGTGGEPAEAPTASAPPSVATTPTVATPSTAPSTAAAPAATSAAPTARGPKPPSSAAAGVVGAVVAATNAERAAAGCDPLKVDGRLNTAAQRHSADMADRQTMSHTGGDGSSFDERIEAAGYPSPGAENVAYGQDSAASVVAAWMDSEGHRRNILNCSYSAIGVGYDARGDYWTQNFGF